MGISERRARERQQRSDKILSAAFVVADRDGWSAFSVERVAAEAELGRATVYGYFESLEALVAALATKALGELSERLAAAPGLAESLDVPLRLSQETPAAFDLLFAPSHDPRPAFSSEEVQSARRRAGEMLRRLSRSAERAGPTLPEDASSAEAFLAAVSMAATLVPELSQSTTLRRRWQDFALGLHQRKKR
ncbi:MAG TPA: helix-turn-helix domain-containing protein [Polyangiaceae bacterium]|nr:helix-turn-helix domain-containing protein [Polyangiaceae bacterium]HMR77002.1 helix-turn-helix domain-containing protein [Polyangiaceae bacterium]